MMDSAKVAEMRSQGKSLAEIASVFGVSRTAVFKKLKKLEAGAQLHQVNNENENDVVLKDVKSTLSASDEKQQPVFGVYENLRKRQDELPKLIDIAIADLAGKAAGWYLGEVEDKLLLEAEETLDEYEKELRAIGLALPLIEKRMVQERERICSS